jgi:hypothetical protein
MLERTQPPGEEWGVGGNLTGPALAPRSQPEVTE